ncbi:MAG TPA: hypothetical protein VNE63_07570 [Candidatus Acidoferrales bacterium]|nr:hypothetical protein [Candidatus Acidoferrales bacterium]
MRKILIGFVLVVLVAVPAYFRFHRSKPPLEIAYVGDRQLTLWSTTAQVREPVATVGFGERLAVLGHSQDQVQVRTAAGIIGWASQRDLLSGELWQRANDLTATAAALPVEARGHTRVLSNLHLEPNREAPRLRQLKKDVPVDLFERRAVEVPAVSRPDGEGAPASETDNAKKEDWWLVRAQVPDQSVPVGWMLGRFIDLDVPAPIPDYASSAGMRIVAWFELNRVMDATGQTKPQYLVVGVRGDQGQPCDFTLLRVYTWGRKRERYETAYVESDVCGKLPVKLSRTAAPGGDAAFSFEDSSNGAPEERTYHMHQTIVRRIREYSAGSSVSKKRR